jgi:release factor glutamine methyltransferase
VTSVFAALDAAARRFAAAGFETPRLEARVLMGALLGVAPGAVGAGPDRVLGADDVARFAGFCARRLAHEPAAYITGQRGFHALDLRIVPGVLIPRPDTETLVEAGLALIAGLPRPHIADLGTGSGAVLLAILAARPDAEGEGGDVSETALALAAENAAQAGLGGRARIVRSSWWSHLTGPFDLVVSNPPYLRSAEIAGLSPGVRDYEPHLALDGGPDGLGCYRAIAAGAAARLAPGGAVAVEIGRGQGPDVGAIFAGFGFMAAGVRADLAGIERVAAFTLP